MNKICQKCGANYNKVNTRYCSRTCFKGYEISEEHRRKIGAANAISKLGRPQSPELIAKRVAKMKDYRPTDATKLKMRLARLANPTIMKGEAHPRWTGKASENMRIRQSKEMKEWRRHVYQRDDYTCQGCGERGGKLQADHELPFSLYPDLRFEILNGRTFCGPCHRKYGWSVKKENAQNKFIQYLK